MTIHVKKGDVCYDDSECRTIEIVGMHFSDWLVKIHTDIIVEDDEDSLDCDVVGENVEEAIFTQGEINRLFGHGQWVRLSNEEE